MECTVGPVGRGKSLALAGKSTFETSSSTNERIDTVQSRSYVYGSPILNVVSTLAFVYSCSIAHVSL